MPMVYDLIVIGGGPAGLMAAGRAAKLGAKVLLLEKNKKPGLKLLSTGQERCNLTNSINSRELIKSFGNKGKFLFSALSRFGAKEVMAFFEAGGVPLKTEVNNRVFPVSNQAKDILKYLLAYLSQFKVETITSATVKEIVKHHNLITKVVLENGQEFKAKHFVFATGGLSYPTTGSTGDGYAWLKNLGHTIVQTFPALTPILIKDKIVKDLEGLSLASVKFTIIQNNKVLTSQSGEAVFTACGLSGPAIFALSSVVARALPQLQLSLDFLPDEKPEALDKHLQTLFSKNKNKQLKNVLARLLAVRLAVVISQQSKINPETEINQITKANRLALIKLIKNFSLEITGVEGYHKAMLTSGGVALTEIDPKTMRSKIIDNLSVVGELLDLDGPTGGFNLQMCWSTGYLAGENIKP
ncbi:aminoacetone oxidase family FAD-binding enzyme [Candidatus Falkowbacteria bacterium CG10_big_fil_rev_8_21_14_0_10_37_14]|uniref:Aminoacetone oxidase family FAD-binding enzyme n=1 Tax=Candidatus Falkowbacteria bacterium CG10_big_fil_rev_8_21_14_0_10_37_14 TaxID=1974561 RepID=A0A2M6WT00_9BACT|nr:NAD(P)/FAD-dependent oxidoreductase [Candidatus Falkowbacteria bacterium]PIT95914.1 MAG: aminoacetone oxidase family FAD-binding enzyme [Candidatus Falkowbacteria bacterium CG10_big_fil_rev_8_21_14_0_10_37_14]